MAETDGIFEREIIVDSEGNEESEFPVAVVDASYFLSAILADFTDGKSQEASAFLSDLIGKNGQIVVPQLFWFELGNVLANAARPKKDGSPAKISRVQLAALERNIADLPIYTDLQPDSEIRLRIRDIALSEGLAYYDAAYLELARRDNVPLKTWDTDLQTAYETT